MKTETIQSTPEKTDFIASNAISPTSIADFFDDDYGVCSADDDRLLDLNQSFESEVSIKDNAVANYDTELASIEDSVQACMLTENMEFSEVTRDACPYNSPVRKPKPLKQAVDTEKSFGKFHLAVVDMILQDRQLPFYKASPARQKAKASPLRNASAIFSTLDFDKIRSLLSCRIGLTAQCKSLAYDVIQILSRNLKYQKRLGARALQTTSMDTWFAEYDAGPTTKLDKETGEESAYYHHHCIIVDVLMPLRKLFKKLTHYDTLVKYNSDTDIDESKIDSTYSFCVSVLCLSNELLKQLYSMLVTKDPALLQIGFCNHDRKTLAELSPPRDEAVRSRCRQVVVSSLFTGQSSCVPSRAYATSLTSILEECNNNGFPPLALVKNKDACMSGRPVLRPAGYLSTGNLPSMSMF